MELHETVCSFLILVVLGIPAKSQKLKSSLPERQDSSVYFVAGILVLCKSAAPFAVELRGKWEAARGCSTLLPPKGHLSGEHLPALRPSGQSVPLLS